MTSSLEGYVYAGVNPSSRKAVFSYKGRAFVRGVIGRYAPSNVPCVMFQSLTAAVPSLIAGGSTVHFHVQHSGRLTGSSSQLKGGFVTVERLNGTKVYFVATSSSGAFRTRPLVPGTYRLVFHGETGGRSPLLDRTRTVTVVSDKTVSVSVPSMVAGGVLTGTATSGGAPITHPVHVIVQRGSTVVVATDTSASGKYSIDGLAAGNYSVSFGKNDVAYQDGSPSAEPTSDDYLPSVAAATIPTAHGTVQLSPALEPAGQITGISSSDSADIVVEQSDGTVVRSETVRTPAVATPTFTLGGLAAGTYTVFYRNAAGLKRLTATVTAGLTTELDSVTPDTPPTTMSGTVTGATDGTVTLLPEPTGYRGPTEIDAIASNGTYSISNVIPGTYPAEIAAKGHPVVTQTITVTPTTTHLDFSPGPLNGHVDVTFTMHGHQAADVTGAVTSTAGDVSTLGYADLHGHASADAAPGSYAFDATSFNFSDSNDPNGSWPVADGAWWYEVPATTFTVTADATTTLTVPLVIGH